MNPFLSAFLSRRLVDQKDGHRDQVLQLFELLKAEERLAPEERKDLRLNRLANLLTHAGNSVPFYKALLKGVSIPPQEAEAVLASLPVLGREMLKEDPKAFTSTSAGPVVEDATGGSTGTPMKFLVDRTVMQAREASLYWADSLVGWKYGERIAMLWGSDRDVLEANRHVKARLRWLIENRLWINTFDLDESKMETAHHRMTRFRPHIIVAYAGSLYTYARFLEQRGLKPSYPSRGLVASAEVCSKPMRETIERVFPPRVFDRYGNREAGGIAAECEAHDGLHVNESDFFVDVLADDKGEGPLLLTYLANAAMPLIRYNTGDIARRYTTGRCSCGRTTEKLHPVKGRVSDTLKTPSGRLVHGEYFTHLMYEAPEVRRFQFVQETLEKYRLVVEVDPAAGARYEAGWRQEILGQLGPGCQLEIAYVESIPPLKSGKHRFTLSLVEDEACHG